MHPGDGVVRYSGDLGDLRAGVDRVDFWRILQKVKICPSPLVLPRLRRDDMFSLQGEFSPGDGVVGHPGDLGELFLSVYFLFHRILWNRFGFADLVLLRLRRDDMLLRPAGRWYGRCRRYGDMGEGEILRLWANVWLSPAVLPEEGPGAGFAEFCKGRVQACQNSDKAGGLRLPLRLQDSPSPSPLRVDDPVVPPLPGSTGNGFVSGALFPLVASRAVCVGRIYSGRWRNYG